MPRQNQVAVDGKMADYREPQHAPGCPCPRCTGKERPPMDETARWKAAAESSTPYCGKCGTVLPEESRGNPCDECFDAGVRSPYGRSTDRIGAVVAGAIADSVARMPAANIIAYQHQDAQGITTAVASVIGDAETHLILATPGWIEARTFDDPRFFALCKYPPTVQASLPLSPVPLVAVRCPACRAVVTRRGLDIGGVVPQRPTPARREQNVAGYASLNPPTETDDVLTRARALLATPVGRPAAMSPDPLAEAIRLHREAGGGLEGRKRAARYLQQNGHYTPKVWDEARRRFEVA